MPSEPELLPLEDATRRLRVACIFDKKSLCWPASPNMSASDASCSPAPLVAEKGSAFQSMPSILPAVLLYTLSCDIPGTTSLFSVNGARESLSKRCDRASEFLKMFGTRTGTPISQRAVKASHMKGFSFRASSKQLMAFFLSSYPIHSLARRQSILAASGGAGREDNVSFPLGFLDVQLGLDFSMAVTPSRYRSRARHASAKTQTQPR